MTHLIIPHYGGKKNCAHDGADMSMPAFGTTWIEPPCQLASGQKCVKAPPGRSYHIIHIIPSPTLPTSYTPILSPPSPVSLSLLPLPVPPPSLTPCVLQAQRRTPAPARTARQRCPWGPGTAPGCCGRRSWACHRQAHAHPLRSRTGWLRQCCPPGDEGGDGSKGQRELNQWTGPYKKRITSIGRR